MPREAFWPPQYEVRLRVYASLAALGVMLGLGLTLFILVLTFSWPRADIGSPTSRVYAGAVDDFVVGIPVTFAEGRFHLVKRDDGSFLALSWKDPHLGCTVPWRGSFEFVDPRDGVSKTGWFRNPCHGETYDAYGVRVFGPAPRNLDQYPVEIVSDEVYVLAVESKLILGETRSDIFTPSPGEGNSAH